MKTLLQTALTLRGLVALPGLVVLAGCAAETGEHRAFVASEIGFGSRTGEQIDGRDVAIGLNLDGRDSDAQDLQGCRRRDFIAPDGTRGIDNQFTHLYELVEDVFQEGVVEGIIKNSINEGRLLLMFQISKVTDWKNDDDVEVAIFLGDGRPNINTENALVRDQTFDIRSDAPVARTRGSIRDGVLRTEPIDVELPMAFFNVFFDLQLRGAQIQAELDMDGNLVGLMGGGVDKEQIFEIGRMADAMQGEQVSPLLNLLIPTWTDLYPDERGICSHISAALTFRSVPAFVFYDVRP